MHSVTNVVMLNKRTKIGVAALLAVLCIAGLLWWSWPQDRHLLRRAARVYGLRPQEEAFWIDVRTLLLVKGDKEHYLEPDEWTGRADILDTSTGKGVPSPGLTRMLNSLHAMPDECEPSPDGRWLLWIVAFSPDHFPHSVLSTLDGSRYYHWDMGKSPSYWLNEHTWIVRERHSSYKPMLTIYDTNAPKHSLHVPVDSARARTLISELASHKEVYAAVDGNGPLQIGRFRADEYYLNADEYDRPDKPRPDRTYPVPIPEDADVYEVKVSPNNQRVLYALSYDRTPPLQKWLHRFVPGVPLKSRLVKSLWTSRNDGTDMHEIGYLEFKDKDAYTTYYWPDLQWLNDSKHILFEHEKSVYSVIAN